MYHIRPLSVVPETIDLPKCMYHIKPLSGIQLGSFTENLSPSAKRVKMDPELQAIEERQLKVIARLRQLRDSVDDLINKAGGPVAKQQEVITPNAKCTQILSNQQSSSKAGDSDVLIENNLPNELVVEANPNRPPLSLLFFCNLAPSLRTVSHTHSSCSQPVDEKLISLFSRDTTGLSNSIVRIVWKNDSASSRLTPPTLGSCGVEGESNVARYLSRVLTRVDDGNSNYDALHLEDLVLVDGVLESSNLVDKAPEQFLNSLQAYVQTRSGSNGAGKRTIADFVGYSTLRYLTKQQPSRSFQKSLIDWMNCLTNEVPSLS